MLVYDLVIAKNWQFHQGTILAGRKHVVTGDNISQGTKLPP